MPMPSVEIQYDHINKRLVALVDGQKVSIAVTITGTWHASISATEIADKTAGAVPAEPFVKALKRYRSNKGRGLLVTLEA